MLVHKNKLRTKETRLKVKQYQPETIAGTGNHIESQTNSEW